MKGKVLDFSIQTNSGIITGEDNKRYQFNGGEWKEQSIPLRGIDVDFDHTEDGQAIGVYLALDSQTATPQSAKFSAQPQLIKQPLSSQGTTGKTEEQYNPWNWYQKCFKNYVNFNGRARRKEFWFFQMIASIAVMVFAIGFPPIAGIFLLIIALPTIAVSIRRLHDTGHSGWWYLLSLTGGWLYSTDHLVGNRQRTSSECFWRSSQVDATLGTRGMTYPLVAIIQAQSC